MMWSLRTASKRLAPRAWTVSSVRANTTIAETVYYRCNYHNKEALALISPREDVQWTYGQLWKQISSLAGGLKSMGFSQGDVIANDCQQHSVGTVLLQLAASHNGMKVMTVLNEGEFNALSRVVPVTGVVMENNASFLSNASFPIKASIADVQGKAPEGVTNRNLELAYYHSAEASTNREVYLNGVGMAGLLEIKAADTLCIATGMNKALGIGSAVSGFVRNAAVYIPDMANLDLGDSTLVITDEGGLDMVRGAASQGSKLRGGVVMKGGDDVLHATEDVVGVKLRILGSGSEAEIMRPLTDACKDTYYSFK
eukprot:CAMPEP_0172713368 /NCGR_PEP_ID=MMETSP1074-20121228/62259_1 /TAXON_ID=2916 /ORGANISM="Ceratium fusus, Strain PA161109" /LENGTH=311 /DNA_ID=CAMNT_0013537449 /DNA_START=53 /DNA_END=988 /DNA_ORIENTATION=-